MQPPKDGSKVIAIITAILRHVLAMLSRPRSRLVSFATVMSTRIRTIKRPPQNNLSVSIVFCALVLVSCQDRASKSDVRPSPASVPASADSRGLANAEAMAKNAKLCEPTTTPVDLEACQHACELNHSNSCANWGQLVAKLEPERARELYDRACKGGSGIGCEARARVAQQSGAGEEEVAERFALARNYHRVHCAQGYARSCAQLGQLFIEDLGVPIDPKTAKEFMRRACNLGWSAACAT